MTTYPQYTPELARHRIAVIGAMFRAFRRWDEISAVAAGSRSYAELVRRLTEPPFDFQPAEVHAFSDMLRFRTIDAVASLHRERARLERWLADNAPGGPPPSTVTPFRDGTEVRLEVVRGLQRALRELDAINLVIRAAADRGDAVLALMGEPFEYTEDQARHIVDMPVSRQTVEARAGLDAEAVELEAMLERRRGQR